MQFRSCDRICRHRLRTLGILAVAATSVVVSACTRTEEPAVVTLPEQSATTSIPTMLAPGDDDDRTELPSDPLEIAWVVQVGGPGDDVFNGVTSATALRDTTDNDQDPTSQNVVAVGASTHGIPDPGADTAEPDTDESPDVLVTRLSTGGDTVRTEVIESHGPAVATSMATVHAPGPSGIASSLPVACGFSFGDLAGPPLGLSDGWCGPVATRLETSADTDDLARIFGFGFTMFAAEANESIAGIATTGPDNVSNLSASQNMFLAGSTDGMFPGAGDSAGRGLGQGDALTFRTSLRDGTSWIRQFGTPFPDAATSVCTTDGNGYFVGWTDGDLAGRSAGGRDGWISMIDSSGMQRWLVQFGYSAEEEFSSVACTGEPAEGTQQFIAVGSTTGDGPKESHGGTDALVASFAPDGSTLWATQVGGSGDDVATAVVVSDDIIYVVGTSDSPIEPGDDPDGSDEEDRDAPTTTEGSESGGDAQGDGSLGAPSRPGTDDQDAGTFGMLDDTIGPGGSRDGFLTAIDATTGAILWTSRFGSAADESVTSATITADGLLVIAGSTTGALGNHESAGGTDAFVVAFQLPPTGGGGAQSWV